jgi:hypothetical protein
MKDKDSLNTLLHEWEAPDAPASMDARVRAAYREFVRPSVWQQVWRFRVSIPIPLLAAVLLLAAVGVWLQSRSGEPTRPATAPTGYMTRLESAGFRPLPDGAVRVIRSGEVKQ